MPLMFSQELSTSRVPSIDGLDSKDLNRQATQRQRIKTGLGNGYRSEYLDQLRQHTKNIKPLEIGDIALLQVPNKDVFTGKNNLNLPRKRQVVQLAIVKIKEGFFLRPLHRSSNQEIYITPCSLSDNVMRGNLIYDTSRSDKIKCISEITNTIDSKEENHAQ